MTDGGGLFPREGAFSRNGPAADDRGGREGARSFIFPLPGRVPIIAKKV